METSRHRDTIRFPRESGNNLMVFTRLFAKGLSYDSSVKVKFVFEPNGPQWPAGACPGLLGMTSLGVTQSLLRWHSSSS